MDIEYEKEQIQKHTQSWSEFVSPEDYMNHVTEDFIYISQSANYLIADNDSMYRLIERLVERGDFVCPVWSTKELIIRNNMAVHKYYAEAEFYSNENDSLYYQDKRMLVDILKKTKEGWKTSVHMFYILD